MLPDSRRRRPTRRPATLEEVNALWTDLKEARRTYEKAEARNLLTDSDEAQVGRLLRGEIEPRHLNPERDNVRGITEVYQAKREYERITGLLRLWNQSRKAEMRTQAEHLLETANAWKDQEIRNPVRPGDHGAEHPGYCAGQAAGGADH